MIFIFNVLYPFDHNSAGRVRIEPNYFIFALRLAASEVFGGVLSYYYYLFSSLEHILIYFNFELSGFPKFDDTD